MRPKKRVAIGAGDLFRARLEQIINLKHELVQLAERIDWDWLDGEIAPLSAETGRPGIETRFVLGLFLLKHMFALSDEEVCARWVYDPYFQHFTGEEFFRHAFPHERSDLSHWRKRLGDKLDLLLSPKACASRMRQARCARRTSSASRWTRPCSRRRSRSRPTPSCCMRRSGGLVGSPASTGSSCASPMRASESGRR